MRDLPEDEIYVRARMGDADAMQEVVASNESRIQARARLATRSRPDLFEDACQEARIGVLRAVTKQTAGRDMGTYINSWVSGKIQNAVGRDLPPETPTAPSALPAVLDTRDPEINVAGREFIERFYALFEQFANANGLDPLDRAIFKERIVSREKLQCELATEYGTDHQRVSEREKKLRRVLPRIFKPLQSAL